METHIRIQDVDAATSPPRRLLAPMLRGLAALSTTLAVLLALLPAPDAAVVQRTLASATINA